MASPVRLVLASRSPSRLRLLRAAGIDAEVDVSHCDERGFDPTRPTDMVAGLALRKATVVARRRSGRIVLGCDSTLELDGLAHGKPPDAAAAATLWRHMRGRAGIVHTGHCLVGADGRQVQAVASTTVRFASLSDAEVTAYVATGEPLGVAGGFTLDGRCGPFIDGIDGDPSNVIGLSLPLLRNLLARLGVEVTELWTGS